jgi:hypothetical protein
MLLLYAAGLLLRTPDPDVRPGATPRKTRLALDPAVAPDPAQTQTSPEAIRRRVHFGNAWDAQLKALEYVQRRLGLPTKAGLTVLEALDPADEPELKHWKFSGELTGKPDRSGAAIKVQWHSLFKGQADGWEEIETRILP